MCRTHHGQLEVDSGFYLEDDKDEPQTIYSSAKHY